MDDARSEHPDEGTIHAWLDGALDDATAEGLAAHVARCRDCAERVAEARGLIAGASRVVGALDDAPSAAGPAWGQAAASTPAAAPAGAGTVWRLLRVTPARAAIAASLLVALGVSLTYDRAALDTDAAKAMLDESAMPAAATPASATIRPRDAVLDSAVARNLAVAQPARVLKAAPGPDIPMPEAGAANQARFSDRSAATRVAVGRAAVLAQRDSAAGLAADQSLAGRAAGRTVGERTVAAARRADSVASPPVGALAASAPAQERIQLRGTGAVAECYRVESANSGAAAWGPVSLPLVVAVDAGGVARVLTVAGQGTDVSALVTRAGNDSLLFRLRRIGFEGTLALGAAGEARAGVMRSRPVQTQLESAVTMGAPTTAEGRVERRAIPQRRAPVRSDAPAAPNPAVASAAAGAVTAAPAVPVVARRVSCP